ncbi:hypothetical protein Ade02nite_20220 [Paractinoplanes deccanensis]|uniref:Uncharacterized protein n=1 Tax=Paractinoplanes deccanensis TaxID=113561 RepID=A0ABQ3Y057_9ACTN|nr:hypothetical protein [Actinoplanes deccanensis]GID73381.1 hypothetical protein Ade02nite_20220 [Actinoplanes deccanensis]
MNHCYGTTGIVQADCGSADPHGEHDFSPTAQICPGAPAGFEADCGTEGPHGEHPYEETSR